MDIAYVSYFFSLLLVFFAAFFVQNCFKKYGCYNFYDITDAIIIVVFVQVIISFIMYLNPEIKAILFSVLHFSAKDREIIDWNGGIRLIGFGSTFFGSGIVNGLALILLSFKLRFQPLSFFHFFIFSFFYLIILFGGMMMSRTTVIGALVGLICYFPSSAYRLVLTNKFLYLIRTVLIMLIVCLCFFIVLPFSIKEKIAVLSEYSFELVVNYVEGTGVSSTSTNRLREMYETYPDNLKTIIIGDGFYTAPDASGGYYKQIDIGYFRLIFYFGILGLFFFILFQYSVIRMACKSFPKMKLSFYLCFILFLLLNLKGVADIVFFVLLFIFNNENKENKSFTYLR